MSQHLVAKRVGVVHGAQVREGVVKLAFQRDRPWQYDGVHAQLEARGGATQMYHVQLSIS
jgi:hypothetical protein